MLKLVGVAPPSTISASSDRLHFSCLEGNHDCLLHCFRSIVFVPIYYLDTRFLAQLFY